MPNEICILSGCRATYLEINIIFKFQFLCLYFDLNMILLVLNTIFKIQYFDLADVLH